MSKRPPYPLAALEAKWMTYWARHSAETTADLGNVGSVFLQSAWAACLETRNLGRGFPGALAAGDRWLPTSAELGRDGCRVAQLSRPGELLEDRDGPTSEELTAAGRFLGRVWRLYIDEADTVAFQQACTVDPSQAVAALEDIGLSRCIGSELPSASSQRCWQTCLQRLEQGIAQQRPHIAVAALIEFVNQAMLWSTRPRSLLAEFLLVLQPFAPILAHELAAKLPSKKPSCLSAEPALAGAWDWPRLDSKFLTETALEISIQVNGKWRDKLVVPADATIAALEKAALSAEKVVPFLQGKIIRRVVVVPHKLVNIAVE